MGENRCPNCGAQGGGPAGCNNCGLGKDPNVGKHWNAGQAQMEIERQRKQEHQRQMSGGSNGCFPTGTPILTPNGLVAIEQLKTGDHVLSPDITGKLMLKKVIKRIDHKPQQIWVIALHNNSQIMTTSIHSFMRNGKWVQAHQLKNGDKISTVSQNGHLSEKMVTASYKGSTSAPVFNLIVAGNFTFIANGAVVHSFSYFRDLRMAFWRIVYPIPR